MPTPALLLVAATLLPLAAFVLLTFVGKRMGNPLAGYVGTAFIAGSFVCTVFALMGWLQGGTFNGNAWGSGKLPINITIPWIPVGAGITQDHPGYLDLGVYVDSLTVLMFCMVTLVSTLVHLFSIGYMREDKRFPRFFTYLGLFCFSMLGLVIGGTLLQLFVFWELVGLCSYLLIGFWYEKKSASNAAMKAFITNRIGDFGFLIGFGILFYHLGNATLPNMWVSLQHAGLGHDVTLPGGITFTQSLLTVMGIGLFFGAVGKSAQFPLHVWLPDAMEGPTPVSALIHAATMVAAGVYLVGRIFPILTPDAKLFIAIIGCITLTMAALIAVAQTDIKKVLAYSTLSQLGYMILAMGIGSWVGGLFHLITHAFFKALLFLGAGSVIHATHHEQELPQYGGLLRKIPVTGITFGIAVLAISGAPLFSGYYSKDLILAHAGGFASISAGKSGSPFYWLLFICPAVIAYVTAFYMTRCWTLTFLGKPRNERLHKHAHESPIMWVPLVVLAILSIFAGNHLGVRDMLDNARLESTHLCQHMMGEKEQFVGFATAWPSELPAEVTHEEGEATARETASGEGHASVSLAAFEIGHQLVEKYVFWCFIVGIGIGLAIYIKGYAIVRPIMRIPPIGAIRTWLYRRMYFDELYFAVFVGLTMAISRLIAAFDKYILDGLVNLVAWSVKQSAFGAGLNDKYVIDGAVNGAAALAQNLGAAVRTPQVGRIRIYMLVLLSVIALGLAGMITVMVIR